MPASAMRCVAIVRAVSAQGSEQDRVYEASLAPLELTISED
jgi:hypothetical protein